MATSPTRRINVFISYSHRDKKWLDRLQVHLRPLEREGRLDYWDDTRIKPGTNWREEIKTAIAAAKVAVLLVSADFLASDFIATHELPPLLAAARQEGVKILPVIVAPSSFAETPDLAQFQAVNSPDQPLIALRRSKQEQVLARVAKTITDLLTNENGEITEVPTKEKRSSGYSKKRADFRRKWDSREIWNQILGFQNDNPSLIYQNQLCVKDYQPGTFTLGEITTDAKFLRNPCRFEEWLDKTLEDEISVINERYSQLISQQPIRETLSEVKRLLELRSDTGQSLRQNIWYQEYSDILRRAILFALGKSPDYPLELYPNLTYKRKELILNVLKWLEENKHPTIKEWLHLSIAAGLLGVNEKSPHAATSEVNIIKAINLKNDGCDEEPLIQRIGEDLWNTSKTECRIDATEAFFHTLNSSAGHKFNIAVFSDDYLETIILLKFYDELLKLFIDVEVDFIPRSIRCGNDASYQDVQEFLANFPDLQKRDRERRFRIIKNGSKLGTINLLKLHREILSIIEGAELIEARGARNYEMMQGINKEIYFSFMVCREFSESATGLFAEDIPLIFIRQLPGEKSFSGFKERYKRIKEGRMLALTTVFDNKEKWQGGHLSEIDKWPVEIKERYETVLKFYSNNARNFHIKYGDFLEIEVQEFLNKLFGKVVVLGCGSGKEVEYLVNRGCEVYGIDFSSEALMIARNEHRELYNHFFLEDMYNIDSFQLGKIFDGVVANAALVHLLQRNDLLLILKKIKSRLSPKGLCFIRVLDKEVIPEEFDRRLFHETRWFVYFDRLILDNFAKEAEFEIIEMDRRPHARYPGVYWISLLLENKV